MAKTFEELRAAVEEYLKGNAVFANAYVGVGGGGGSGGNTYASGHNGGACGGGLSLGTCRCGQPATRINQTSGEIYCAACGPVKRFDLPIKADVGTWEVHRIIEPAHCPCGAELMGSLARNVNLVCGDCAMAEALPGRPRADLDTRIKAAAKPDADPTSEYGAWASPTWES